MPRWCLLPSGAGCDASFNFGENAAKNLKTWADLQLVVAIVGLIWYKTRLSAADDAPGVGVFRLERPATRPCTGKNRLLIHPGCGLWGLFVRRTRSAAR